MSSTNIAKLVVAGVLVVIGFVVFKKALGMLIPVALVVGGAYFGYRWLTSKKS